MRTKLEQTLLKKVQKGVRAERQKRLQALVKRGLPRHRAEQIAQAIAATPVKLVRRGGDVVAAEARVDVELSTLEGMLGKGGWVQAGKGKARRAARPEVEEQVDRKFIREQAAAVSVTQRRG